MKRKLTRDRLRSLQRHFGFFDQTQPDHPVTLSLRDFDALLEAAAWAIDGWYIGLDTEAEPTDDDEGSVTGV